MNTEQYFDTIEKYFEGQMTAAEEAAFEAEMENNPALKATVENYDIANEAIELLVENNLRSELNELRQAVIPNQVISTSKENKPTAKVFKMRALVRNLSIAASIALVIGFFTFQYMGHQYSNDGLRTANYGEVNFSTIRGENEEATNSALALEEATAAWTAKNYDKAIQLTESIPATDGYYAKAQYILGHSLYQKGDFKKAQTAFEIAENQQDEKYTEKAQWYSILAAIGTNADETIIQNKLDAIIADKGHAFETKAKELKADLNSFWR